MGSLRNKVTFFAFCFAQMSYLGLAVAAVDLLAQSKMLAVPARTYPELKQSIKTLSAYYDQELREIANIR